jgi:hypothetical protein
MDRLFEAVTRLTRATGIGDGQTAWELSRQVVREYQDVFLRNETETVIDRYFYQRVKKIEDMSATDATESQKRFVIHSLVGKWSLLQRCREIGVENAFDELAGRLSEDWHLLFVTFVSHVSRAADWVTTRDLLRGEYRDLLSMQARRFLDATQFFETYPGSDGSITLGELFVRVEAVGLDAAFEDLVEFGTDVPADIRAPLRSAIGATNRYREAGDRISLNEAIGQWAAVLADRSFAAASPHTQRTYLAEAGNAHEYRYRERDELSDLDTAIALWRQSAEVGARQGRADPAEFLHYLGYSYERRHHRTAALPRADDAGQDGSSDLDLAIEYYDRAFDAAEAATDGLPPAPFLSGASNGFQKWKWLRQQRAHYRNAAGLACVERYQNGGSAHDLDAAVKYCRAATEVAEQEKLPAPSLYDDLGRVLALRYSATGEADDADAALRAYKRALEWCTSSSPLSGLDAATHYGLLLYVLGEVTRARAALETAHAWAEDARIEQTSPRSRLVLAGFTTVLYETLVTCCLLDGDDESAFRYAAAAKGRSFVDALMASRVDLATLHEDHPALGADLQPYLRLRAEIDTAKALVMQPQALLPGQEPDLRRSVASTFELLADLRRREKIMWTDLVSRYRILAAMQETPPMPVSDARRLAEELGVTLIEYYRHRQGWCAFVVTPDRVVCRSLPDIDEHLMDDLAAWVRGICEHNRRDSGKEILTRWYDAVVRPVRDDLAAAGTNLVAPFGAMHGLPYGAAVERDSGAYVLDEFDLGFAPSLSALARIWERRDTTDAHSPDQPVDRILGVAYPGPPTGQHLANAKPEVEAILACFDGAQVTALTDDRATPDGVIAHAPGQDVIHISCHGWFDPRFPAQSGLILSTGWLTARRIVTELDLSRVRLFTMSGCSTARSGVGDGDELEGLTQAAMMAGAPTVVASLWPVDDAATRELLTSFYGSLIRGSTPIQAMNAATRSLRKRNEWNHPYYWCGFVVSGLGQFPLGSTTGIG